MSRKQCFVIGGGVVGLAVARALSRSLEVVLLESRAVVGSQTSSRNSGVIHSGIYYDYGSLKAQLCAPGCKELYRYLLSRNVEHNKCGKIISATSAAEVPMLQKLMLSGQRNGVEGLTLLSDADMQAMEPSLRGHCGLHVPDAGIVNSHELMLALQSDAEAGGAVIVTNCSVIGARVSDSIGSSGDNLITIYTNHGTFESDIVVNCAGHQAPSVAARIIGHPLERVPQPYYCKGNYFKLEGVKSPFKRLVYPIPVEHGLGVHATIDMTGSIKFGPDTEWIEPTCTILGEDQDSSIGLPEWAHQTFCDKDYVVDAARSASFYAEIRKYWPQLPDGALTPDYSGFRPKIIGPKGILGTPSNIPGRNLKDFLIEGPQEHNVRGLVNLYGIESPGLTSCLTIAEYVLRKISSQ